jgi:hypothetical protein
MRIEGSQPPAEGRRVVREVTEVRRSPEVAREEGEGRRVREGEVGREPHRAGEAERSKDGRVDAREERGPDRLEVSREGLERLRSDDGHGRDGLGRGLTE